MFVWPQRVARLYQGTVACPAVLSPKPGPGFGMRFFPARTAVAAAAPPRNVLRLIVFSSSGGPAAEIIFSGPCPNQLRGASAEVFRPTASVDAAELAAGRHQASAPGRSQFDEDPGGLKTSGELFDLRFGGNGADRIRTGIVRDDVDQCPAGRRGGPHEGGYPFGRPLSVVNAWDQAVV